ncbi:disulfide oxidoreductase [Arcobacter porcinus]|uniref:Disulfide bond formation protein C n=1 Tax=Arcobacter porcinus TaxID=1935204 RepID=A0ABX2YE08_9BACT|nr:disulfide oxidoreductase [Arcobacter porcinus]OCL93166.1 Disulfide bond formation protein C [Arcobacter porcinus]
MNPLFLAFFTSLLATFGSLFFSEIMNFIPCSLCWYQRIFMYPLLFILTISLLYKDSKVILNATPLAIVGFLISIYHNLLVYKIIPEDLSPCIGGVPCSVDYLNVFGFITIPLLSTIAFLIILISLMLHYLSLVKVSEKLRENHAK